MEERVRCAGGGEGSEMPQITQIKFNQAKERKAKRLSQATFTAGRHHGQGVVRYGCRQKEKKK